MTVLSSEQSKRFCPSPCAICGEPALEIYVTLKKLHFECGRCGSFDIAVAAKSAISGKPLPERREWLAQARRHDFSTHGLVFAHRMSEP